MAPSGLGVHQVMGASFGPSVASLAAAGKLQLPIAGALPVTACVPLSARLDRHAALVLRGNCTFSVKVGLT